MNKKELKKIEKIQKSELLQHSFYKKIAKREKNGDNKAMLNKLSLLELKHYNYFKSYTNKDYKVSVIKLYFHYLLTICLGLNFGLRFMEKSHTKARFENTKIRNANLKEIVNEEYELEEGYIDQIDKKKLNYISSIVLGLNDALVEFTGAIAGFTFALASSKTIAIAIIISGISASLSMASSEYLSKKQDYSSKEALIPAIYTGLAYIITVSLMIVPYLVFPNVYISLVVMLSVVVLIILFFNYYISIAKKTNFKKIFLEMILISLGVALISFAIGLLVRVFFGEVV